MSKYNSALSSWVTKLIEESPMALNIHSKAFLIDKKFKFLLLNILISHVFVGVGVPEKIST